MRDEVVALDMHVRGSEEDNCFELDVMHALHAAVLQKLHSKAWSLKAWGL